MKYHQCFLDRLIREILQQLQNVEQKKIVHQIEYRMVLSDLVEQHYHSFYQLQQVLVDL